MKKCTRFLALFGVLGLASIIVGVGSANAELKFQTSQVVQFEFNPTLSLDVSGDMVVNNLTAGGNADSNEITVAISTNSAAGYYLTATAGTSSTTNDLVNTSNSNYVFSSLATDASLDSMASADDNQWGYTFKLANSDSYNNYSGLPKDADDSGETGAVLIDTTDSSDGKTIIFKIGAKAGADQPAGEYTNVVNFYAVSHLAPKIETIDDLKFMQDFAAISDSDKAVVLASMVQDREYTLKDKRDNKDYYIAKLADGNVWMTQNLDHDIVTIDGFYTPENTDIPANWVADSATYATGTDTWGDYYTTLQSYDPGDLCWNGIVNTSGSGTLDTMTIACTDQNANRHYSIGNYYNWTAAVAMNDSSSYTGYEIDAGQSICPAGWMLPVHKNNKSYDNLMNGLGLIDSTGSNVQDAPVYFVPSGYWTGVSDVVGSGASYWTSVIVNSGQIFSFNFDIGSYFYPQGWDYRNYSANVRCVAR